MRICKNFNRVKKRWIASPLFLALSFYTSPTLAGGYQNSLTSIEGLGRAFAGEVASDGVLATFHNPANILLQEDKAFSNAFTATWLRYKIETTRNPYARIISPAKIAADPFGFAGAALGGNIDDFRHTPVEDEDINDAGTKIVIPAVAYAQNMGGWGFGIASGSHFAYDFDPKSLYSVGDTFGDLYFKIAHVTTNWAMQVSDNISVGLGLSAIVGFFKADRRVSELANVVSGLDDLLGEDLTSGVLGALGSSGLRDPDSSVAKFKGNDVGFGWNVGITWQPSPNDRFSFVYFHQAELEFDGEYRSDLPSSLNFLGALYNGVLGTGVTAKPGQPLFPEPTDGEKIDATVELELPAWMEYGGWHRIRQDWEVYYSVRWTNWTRSFEGISIKAKDGSGRGADFPVKVTDNIKFSVGADYRVNHEWKVRAGFAVDESWHASQDDMLLNSPDSRRWWFGTGATWKQNETTSWDFALGYIYFEGDTVKEDTDLLERTRDRLPGLNEALGIDDIRVEADIKTSILTAGIQFNKKF